MMWLQTFYQGRAQWPVEPIDSDPDANYAQTVKIDLSSLEPIVAFPHKPANTTPISRLQDMIAGASANLHQISAPLTMTPLPMPF